MGTTAVCGGPRPPTSAAQCYPAADGGSPCGQILRGFGLKGSLAGYTLPSTSTCAHHTEANSSILPALLASVDPLRPRMGPRPPLGGGHFFFEFQLRCSRGKPVRLGSGRRQGGSPGRIRHPGGFAGARAAASGAHPSHGPDFGRRAVRGLGRVAPVVRSRASGLHPGLGGGPMRGGGGVLARLLAPRPTLADGGVGASGWMTCPRHPGAR